MSSLSKLGAAFTATMGATLLASCGTATPSEPVADYQTKTSTPAIIDISTRFEKAIFSEIRPQDNTNLTCFTLSSIYLGSEGHADIECIEGQSQAAPAGQTARVAFQATIGKTNLFTIRPVTRPDVECRATTSVYLGSEGGGHISCTKVTQAPTP